MLKQLIQEPKYALDVATTARPTMKTALPSVADIKHMYAVKKPNKNMVDLLSANVKDAAQNHLMQFRKLLVKSLDSERMTNMLHFVIQQVEFTDLKGLQRRPVAHICGPLLQVPSTYINYTAFRRGVLQCP